MAVLWCSVSTITRESVTIFMALDLDRTRVHWTPTRASPSTHRHMNLDLQITIHRLSFSLSLFVCVCGLAVSLSLSLSHTTTQCPARSLQSKSDSAATRLAPSFGNSSVSNTAFLPMALYCHHPTMIQFHHSVVIPTIVWTTARTSFSINPTMIGTYREHY